MMSRTEAFRRWLRDLLAEDTDRPPNHSAAEPRTDDTREEPASSPHQAGEAA